ncbi:MAG: hypothetical protein JWO06_1657 [Bacteroidota bacterium]|nr:hypothetical protein [Bacteroidota bacterium]
MGYKEILLQRKLAEADNNNIEEKEVVPEVKNIKEATANPKFFGLENVNGMPTCLDLRFGDGLSLALPYSYIIEFDFDPSEGIEITTSGKKITIEGRSLQMLYNHLISYRVKYIQANIGNDLTGDRDLFVKTIKIEEI